MHPYSHLTPKLTKRSQHVLKKLYCASSYSLFKGRMVIYTISYELLVHNTNDLYISLTAHI